jgi:pilus assembly protein CpaB
MTNSRRTVGIIAAVVLALLGTLGLVAYVQGAKDRAVAGEKLVKVYVARDHIAAGTPASDVADKVKTEKVPAKVQATHAVTNLKDIKGTVATIEVVPGEQLVTTRFSSNPTLVAASHSSKGVPVGFFGSTVSLEPEQALGGQVRAGDRVAVVGMNDVRGVNNETTAAMIARNVLVTSVQIDGSNGADPEKKQVTEAPTGKFFVTLALTQKDLESVVTAVNAGKVWLAADPGGF